MSNPVQVRWGRRPGWELVRSPRLGPTKRIKIDRQRWPAGCDPHGYWWDLKISVTLVRWRWSLYRFRVQP